MKIKNNKIIIKNNNRQSYIIKMTIGVLLLITIYSFIKIDIFSYNNNPIMDAHYFRIIQMIKGIFKFNFSDGFFIKLIKSFFSTLGLGVLSTLIGLIFGTVLALFSASNISNKYLSLGIKSISAAVRAVPTFLIVLLCISLYGMTGTSAVIGMIFHSSSFFIKVLGEVFEEVDKGSIEAIRSLGGNWLNIVTEAILPESLTKILAWSAFRLEINFGVAIIMGPLAAVPNSIGTELKQAVSTYNFLEIFIIISVIHMSMMLLQKISQKLKGRTEIN